MARHLVLIGLMASGKSTVGVPLAARLGRAFVDNDVTLELREGQTARAIQAEYGPDVLHREEADALRAELGRGEPAVVSAAAGAILQPDIPAALRGHSVVYLHVDPATLARRIAAAHATHRPFGGRDPSVVIAEQYAARDAKYRDIADLVVDATKPADEIVDAIISAFAT